MRWFRRVSWFVLLIGFLCLIPTYYYKAEIGRWGELATKARQRPDPRPDEVAVAKEQQAKAAWERWVLGAYCAPAGLVLLVTSVIVSRLRSGRTLPDPNQEEHAGEGPNAHRSTE